MMMGIMNEVFEIWHSPTTQSHTLVIAGYKTAILEPDAVVVQTLEVEHWLEASIIFNEFCGYEPYEPMLEDRVEYLASLKRLGKTGKGVNDEREKHNLPRLDWLED